MPRYRTKNITSRARVCKSLDGLLDYNLRKGNVVTQADVTALND